MSDYPRGLTATELVDRIRAALGRSAGDAVAPAPEIDDRLLRRCAPDEDLAARFVDAAEQAGMIVHRCRQAELDATLSSVLTSHGAGSATLSVGHPALEETVRAVLERSACPVRDPDGPDGQYEVDVGVTDVTAAIAETGSIVVAGDDRRSRCAFLVPPVHVALVDIRQVVPDLQDFWDAVAATPTAKLPAGAVIITGPSKTADIEGILITGVHGPREVHVILCDE